MPGLEPLHNDLNHETIELIAEAIEEKTESADQQESIDQTIGA